MSVYRSGLMLRLPVRGHESIIVLPGDEHLVNAKGRVEKNPTPTLPSIFQCQLCQLLWPLHLPPFEPCTGRARAIRPGVPPEDDYVVRLLASIARPIEKLVR